MLARTQAELEALGRSRLAREAAGVARRTGQAIRDPHTWRKGALQVDTAVRGAANTITGGNENMIAAAGDALLGRGGKGDLFQRYQANLAEQEARDEYDRVHRPLARITGETAGLGLLYKAGERAGTAWSRRLPSNRKGDLGEDLSAIKTVVKGDWPAESQVPLKVRGGETIVDHATRRSQYVEAKLGRYARPSPRQREAMAEQGGRYRLDRWQDHHVGRIAGTGAAAAGWPFNGDDDW